MAPHDPFFLCPHIFNAEAFDESNTNSHANSTQLTGYDQIKQSNSKFE